MKKLTAQRRGLLGGAAAAAVAVGLAVVAGVMSPAHAAVDPKGADARFIHIYDKGCLGSDYRAEGYLIDGSGAKIPDSTWKVWEGDLDCNRVVFAWEPANDRARIDVAISNDGKTLHTQIVPGNKNYCLKSVFDGSWEELWSSVGGGGSGECTPKL
jgi:hypothetical protein